MVNRLVSPSNGQIHKSTSAAAVAAIIRKSPEEVMESFRVAPILGRGAEELPPRKWGSNIGQNKGLTRSSLRRNVSKLAVFV